MQRIQVIVSGCNGRMGQVVTRMCAERADMQVCAGFDLNCIQKNDYPVFTDPMSFDGHADVIVDFSNAAFLDPLLDFALARGIPAVICTTGHSPEQLQRLREASGRVPMFRSGNMSLGINLLANLVKKAAAVLGPGFDVEIVERHHRMKVDAPSGTALMLADAAAAGMDEPPAYVYERQSVRRPRGDHEIGISSVRGGTIVGEHEVIFAGPDEVIEFRHTAQSREVFANGAIAAAAFLAGVKTPGLYTMDDVLSEVLSL